MCTQVGQRKIIAQGLQQPTNNKFGSLKLKKKKKKGKMEASIEAKNSATFSPAEREAILEILEECADSLIIYHNTLGQQPVMRGDAVNFYPKIEYVQRIRCNKKTSIS